MFYWRITKYNPKDRNSDGYYLKDEWTSYSDINKVYNHSLFTLEEYLKTEAAYINAIMLFADCLQVNHFRIVNLEKRMLQGQESQYPIEIIALYASIKEGDLIKKETIPLIAQLILREDLWCKLESKQMSVHFGYDYYLYIGSKQPCGNTIKEIEQSGLFVESIESSPWSEN